MSNYSAGPWQVKTDDDGEVWVEADSGHSYHVGNMEGVCGTCLANADLIAAAPELLAAADNFLNFFERVSLVEVSSDLAEAMVALRDAVSKAKGEVTA